MSMYMLFGLRSCNTKLSRNTNATVFQPRFSLVKNSSFSKSVRFFSEDSQSKKPGEPLIKNSPIEEKPSSKQDDLAALLTMVLEMKVTKPVQPASRPGSMMKPKTPPTPVDQDQLKADEEVQLSLDKLLSLSSAPSSTSKGDKDADQLLDDLLASDSLKKQQPMNLGKGATVQRPRRIFSIGGKTGQIKPKAATKTREPGLGDNFAFDDNYDNENFVKDDEESGGIFDFFGASPSGKGGSSIESIMEVFRDDTKLLLAEVMKGMERENKANEVFLQRVQKKLLKRWRNLAHLRRVRKERNGLKEPPQKGRIHPQLIEGFGNHFTPIMKDISSTHKLRPIIDLYSRKLANNGTLTWEQKYKGMKLGLKYLHRRSIPKDHIPGVSGITKPIGTENESFEVTFRRNRALLDSLSEGDEVATTEAMIEINDESIFQDEDETFEEEGETKGGSNSPPPPTKGSPLKQQKRV